MVGAATPGSGECSRRVSSNDGDNRGPPCPTTPFRGPPDRPAGASGEPGVAALVRGASIWAMRVFMLNGTSSAGKTTLATALEKRLAASGRVRHDDEPRGLPRPGAAGLDGVPPLPRRRAVRARTDVPDRRRTAQPAGSVRWEPTIAAYRSTVAAVARTGPSVIVDDVPLEKDDWLSWRQHLAGLDVVWVGLTVPLDVLEQRESERGDRAAGQGARKMRPSIAM